MTNYGHRFPPNPRRDEILALARTGMTGGQIAKALGVTRGAVIGICWRAGVSPGKPEDSYRSRLAWWESEQRLKEMRDMLRT